MTLDIVNQYDLMDLFFLRFSRISRRQLRGPFGEMLMEEMAKTDKSKPPEDENHDDNDDRNEAETVSVETSQPVDLLQLTGGSIPSSDMLVSLEMHIHMKMYSSL